VKRYWKIFILVAALAAAGVYAVVIVPRAADQRANVVCSRLHVVVVDSAINGFVHKEDVPIIFRAAGLSYFGKKLSEISTAKLEAALNARSLIRHADVYITVDGTLHVRIAQRHPIIRIYADNGDSFYIDNDGFVMQQYPGYTADVPIVNGNVKSPFPQGFKGDMQAYLAKQKKPAPLMEQLFVFAKFLAHDEFWQAQVEQLYITPRGKVEIIPRIGAHIIRMGSLDNFEYKLHKLRVMYDKGLPVKGWNAYEVLDVSYGNQVVCQRK
jgi:cell division protein FtsQ